MGSDAWQRAKGGSRAGQISEGISVSVHEVHDLRAELNLCLDKSLFYSGSASV